MITPKAVARGSMLWRVYLWKNGLLELAKERGWD
jgi:hypothetical protein